MPEARQEAARTWFEELRDRLCAEFEAIEDALSAGPHAGLPPGRFVRTPWDRAGGGRSGLEEMGVSDGILAIEWPDRLTHTPAGARPVQIEIIDETTRRIRIRNRV